MFFRNLKFFILMTFSLPTVLSAMEPNADKDLILSYRIPPHKKNALFSTLVKGAIPGKLEPDDYRITLGIVKNVKRVDFTLLGDLLGSVARIHLDRSTFTPKIAAKYLVNRTPHQSPLVLTPKDEEVVAFKKLNKILHKTLQEYNTQTGKQYKFGPDVMPSKYVPHLILVDNHYIKDNALDRDELLKRVNRRLNGKTLELMQWATPQRKPVSKLRNHSRSKHRRYAHPKYPSEQRLYAAPIRHRQVRYVGPSRRASLRHVAPGKHHHIRHKARQHKQLSRGRRHKHR